jgi:hypothetical protein
VALGAGRWGSKQPHWASERSVGYVVLMHARVALPTADYPFLDSFGRGILRTSLSRSCIAPTPRITRMASETARAVQVVLHVVVLDGYAEGWI